MDISELLSRPHDMNPGSAAPYLEAFAAQMALVGHTSLTISFYLDSAIHFGGWLEAKGLDFADIDEEIIKAFRAHRCECPGHRHQKSVSREYTARVQRFADFLRQHGAIRATADSKAGTPSALSPFRDWLLQHRGLAMPTVERHERLINKMLPALGTNAGEYNAASVRRVILNQIRGCRPAHAKTFVGALRAETVSDAPPKDAWTEILGLLDSPWHPLAQALRLAGLRSPDEVDWDWIEAGKVSGKRALMMWSTKNGLAVLVDAAAGIGPGPNIVTAEPNSKPAAVVALLSPLLEATQ